MFKYHYEPYSLGMSIVLGTIILAVAVMMMISIIPAMAQPINTDSTVPETDAHLADGKLCVKLIELVAKAKEGPGKDNLIKLKNKVCFHA